MFDKIFNKYGREKENKDGTLNYEDIQKLLLSHDVNVDCKLESYKDFEKILNSQKNGVSRDNTSGKPRHK